ncbi:hypothetical protein ACNO7I_04665 [Bisgaard Taxon 45]
MDFEFQKLTLPYCAFFGSDLNLTWLFNASKEEQEEALFEWFTLRYEEPVHSLPYISREGGYQYIYGGPIDPYDELEQFEKYTSYDVIQDVAQRLYDIAEDTWTPIPQYSNDYQMKETPIDRLKNRINKAIKVLKFSYIAQIIDINLLIERSEDYGLYAKDFLVHQLKNNLKEKDEEISYLQALSVFSLLFTAFETYMWEITKCNLDTKGLNLRKNLINTLKDFEIKKSLSEIYNENYNFDRKLEDILDNETVWHNINNITKIFKNGFQLNTLPDFHEINKLLITRNNIVHRFGLDKDGHAISLQDEDILNAKKFFIEYCESLDLLIQERICNL